MAVELGTAGACCELPPYEAGQPLPLPNGPQGLEARRATGGIKSGKIKRNGMVARLRRPRPSDQVAWWDLSGPVYCASGLSDKYRG